jgi:glycosyltransferase involved in cell wall biosynthesis
VRDLEAVGAIVRSINWTGAIRDPLGALGFWNCYRRHKFAIVHHHFGGRMVRRIVRSASDVRLVVHLHARISDVDAARDVPVSVRNADLVIAVSNAVARQLKNQRPVVVHSGVELGQSGEFLDRKAGTPIVVGAASRLVDIKGLPDLIEAMALLSPDFPNLRLEIAGEGPDLKILQEHTRRLSLAESVRFLGWQRDMKPVYQGWDIFAMPSLTEAFPMAALEAMAQRLPVVATNVGGLPEMVDEGRTGYLVPPSHPEALANTLRTLILDADRRQQMGAAGYRRVQEHFSVDRMIAQTAGIYRSLLAGQICLAL